MKHPIFQYYYCYN